MKFEKTGPNQTVVIDRTRLYTTDRRTELWTDRCKAIYTLFFERGGGGGARTIKIVETGENPVFSIFPTTFPTLSGRNCTIWATLKLQWVLSIWTRLRFCSLVKG